MTSHYSLPAVLFIPMLWAIDSFLFIVCMRLTYCRLHGRQNDRIANALRALVDPLHQALGKRLARQFNQTISARLVWIVCVLGLLMCRCIVECFVTVL